MRGSTRGTRTARKSHAGHVRRAGARSSPPAADSQALGAGADPPFRRFQASPRSGSVRRPRGLRASPTVHTERPIREPKPALPLRGRRPAVVTSVCVRQRQPELFLPSTRPSTRAALSLPPARGGPRTPSRPPGRLVLTCSPGLGRRQQGRLRAPSWRPQDFGLLRASCPARQLRRRQSRFALPAQRASSSCYATARGPRAGLSDWRPEGPRRGVLSGAVPGGGRAHGGGSGQLAPSRLRRS